MSEGKTNLKVRIDKNKMFIEDKPSETKLSFYETMEDRVVILNNDEYTRQVDPSSGMARVEATIYKIPSGKQIDDAIIYVNRDDFNIDGVDYTDLITISVRHEIAELWMYAKTGYSLSPPPKHIGAKNRETISHRLALNEEYQYAFTLGKAERYLDFVKKWASSANIGILSRRRIVNENEIAFKIAKSRSTEGKSD